MYARCAFAALTVVAALAAPVSAGREPAARNAADGEDSSASTEGSGLLSALRAGETSLGLRYRHETVSVDSPVRDAHASTLRTTLGWKSGSYYGWRVFLEAEDVSVLGDRDGYRNAGAGALSNGVDDRAVVADPALTELNQAGLRWQGRRGELVVGRQEINLADQRLVGAVGWRQNHQSFEAVLFRYRTANGIGFEAAQLESVQRIFGDARDLSGQLLQVDWGHGPVKLRAYVLEVDFERFAGLSTRTAGAEGRWTTALTSRRSLEAEIEYAVQEDAGANPDNVEADYLHWSVGLSGEPLSLWVGGEELSGAPDEGRFATPLATLHKFNGWADQFLQTPENGLRDLHVGLGAQRGAWLGELRAHRFDAASGGAEYGDELDLLVRWKSGWGQTFALKMADYGADGHSVDTTKWMLWTEVRFP